MSEPPGEADLRALARRFEDAESRIRELIAQAPEGNRRELLTEALGILVALRQEDLRRPVVGAYLVAFRAVRRGGELRTPKDLADSLAQKLDQAAATASEGSREAFRRASGGNLEEATHQAVTAHTDRQGKRWPLGAYAAMQTETLGRRASSRGTLHGVGPDGLTTISTHGTRTPICIPLEGKTFPATSAPQPPFHPNCKHYLIPA